VVMLSAHATRSRICLVGTTFRVLQPSTFRSVICPLANNAQNSMQAVSAQGSMHWVLMRRVQPLDGVVRMDFHWSLGNRRKVRIFSPASSRLSATCCATPLACHRCWSPVLGNRHRHRPERAEQLTVPVAVAIPGCLGPAVIPTSPQTKVAASSSSSIFNPLIPASSGSNDQTNPHPTMEPRPR
jgi:hypothetical protein